LPYLKVIALTGRKNQLRAIGIMTTIIKQAFSPTQNTAHQNTKLVMAKLQAKLFASLLVSAFVISAGVSA